MISEMTLGVRRLEGPGASAGFTTEATAVLKVFPTCRSWAVANCPLLWLHTASPTKIVEGKLSVTEPRRDQPCPS
jgi:hypothetical protein